MTSAGAHATLPGDFNGDNVVNAGDYVAWRKTDGTPGGYNTCRANFGESAAGPSLPGDFNGNGTVDAADYVVWRKGLGTTYTQDDYNTWQANFGATLGSGSSSAFPTPPSALDNAVPEPTSLILLMLTLVPPIWSFRANRWAVGARTYASTGKLGRGVNSTTCEWPSNVAKKNSRQSAWPRTLHSSAGEANWAKTNDGGPAARLVVAKQFQLDLAGNDCDFVTTDALGRIRFVFKQFRANIGRNGKWQHRVVGTGIQQHAQIRLAGR